MPYKNKEDKQRYARLYTKPAPARNPQGERWCSGYKTGGHFTSPDNFNNSRRVADGLSNMCKGCKSKESKANHTKNRGIKWNAKLYGLAPGWETHYTEQKELQDNQCALCGAVPSKKSLQRDHSHQGGYNRGLLCVNCNHALERLETHSGWETKARAYLDCWEKNQGKSGVAC